ncbi:type VI secretion system protein TssA [Maridesulfovibrio hydrothermalis]|uniref:Type VI secretion-associated protein, VC_A0119 family n=1 Tax=Maridesulfovibrio hydrothermalis AM13 = DSM 14728 TaxID=1121451 RepID=L0RF17_9BACT|nr:type VI secretion system protein TssA [Maridesulfovibrio hydrothermalis]CCO24151.1 Type VI secretion-associated protein, VC_A0119 family [Maridesulfovibrio hydrothermalis AM13 = DSM 14728]
MELLDLGKKPVSEASPAGADARYEPEYDELQQEVDKLTSVTAGGVIDWKHVVKLCSVILFKKSKDIKVASYLGVGLINLKGVEGLSAGAQILSDLVSNYWDTMYPAKKRMRGRFNAVSWWSDKAEEFLGSYEGEDLTQETVDLLVRRIKKLDEALADKSEDAPVLNSLIGYADRLPVQAAAEPSPVQGLDEKASPEPSDVQAETPTGDAASTSVPSSPASPAQAGSAAVLSSPVGNINSHEDYLKELNSGLTGLSGVADYLLANDIAGAPGYRLRRISAWLPVSSPPPSENGKTMIPPPDSSVKESIVRQLENRDFAGAIQAAESRVGQYLFWLDLSRLTVDGLDGLGGDYLEAKYGLELETVMFVKRMSGLESMTFADGTPFADSKTKAWLRSLDHEKTSGLGSGVEQDSVSEKVYADAVKLVKNKKIFDAVTLLHGSLKSSPSGRERFLLRLGMVRLLSDVGQSALAHVHVEEVLGQIKKFGLEEWAPDLALNGLMTVYEALISEGGDEAVVLAEKTLQRISRIGPAEALKINGFN